VLPRSSATDRLPRTLAIAPWWHTAPLVLVFAASGFFHETGAPASPAGAALAQGGIAIMLVCYVAAGMRLRGHHLAELWGRFDRLDPLWGLLAAALMLALWLLLMPAQAPLPPRSRALWLLVSVVVACSEELVFRGYLQRQFSSRAGFWPAAFAQAALFGAAHANQGLAAAFGVSCCGLALACLVRARGGLAAAVVAHFALDACAAFWS
jgi:membrane protease YdiL (CAAX protease family)